MTTLPDYALASDGGLRLPLGAIAISFPELSETDDEGKRIINVWIIRGGQMRFGFILLLFDIIKEFKKGGTKLSIKI